MKYEDRRMEMMKDSSRAVAMMVLHTSSHIISGGRARHGTVVIIPAAKLHPLRNRAAE